MKTLIITPQNLPVHRAEQAGAASRFNRFLTALGKISDEIRILYVSASEPTHSSLGSIQAGLRDLTGAQVLVDSVSRRVRTENAWNHYISGIGDACEQPQAQAFCGPEQVSAIEALLAEKPDIVFVHRLTAMLAVLKCRPQPENMFFDLDDVEHRVLYRQVFNPPIWPGKLAYLAHIPALMRAERQGISRSKLTFVCSKDDKMHLNRFAGGEKVLVVPNTADVPVAPPGLVAAPSILYLGTFQYAPNIEAAERLITRILPLIRLKIPNANVMIAGKDSDRIPSCRANPANVQFLGFVPDLDALYVQTRIVCCPLTVGGGTRIKLIEAAAQARPMVATHIGAEGLEFRDEQEILLRDSDTEIAEACIRLMTNDADATRLGAAARQRMLEFYRPEDVVAQIATAIGSSLQSE